MKKRILSFIMILCFILPLCAVPAEALTLQERYYLEVLYPNPPKDAASYPARLIVNIGGKAATLEGTCGMNASLTDEEMLDILKRALPAVSTYNELEKPVKDKNLVSELTEKLKFSDEDMQEILKNLRAILGLDDIPGALLPIELPDVGPLTGDLFQDYETISGAKEFGEQAGEIADILMGKGDLLDFLTPDVIPSADDIVINGIKISWEQFQKDKEKYKDIIALYQAKSRLRQYYARVDELVKAAMDEKGAWAIRIYDQVVTQEIYNPIYDQLVPYIWTADIELVKNDGSMGNINGTYTGSFSLKMENDLTEYDSRRHILYAEYANKKGGSIGGFSVPNGYSWSGVSVQINSPSESKIGLNGENVSVTLSLPAGTNRTFFELPLDAMALEQTEYVNTCDYVMVAKGVNQSGSWTTTWTEIYETSSYYQSDHHLIVISGVSGEETHEDSGQLPTDMRPYISITLVVDMLSN